MSPHVTGALVILGNLAAFLYGELAEKWPANGHDWTLIVLAAIASLATTTTAYRLTPPVIPTLPAHENPPAPPRPGPVP